MVRNASLHRVVSRDKEPDQNTRPAYSCENNPAAPVIESNVMQAVFRLARKLGSSTIPVLIEGETGVGKGLLAETIHANGTRSFHKMVCVNCGSVPAQLAESIFFGHERGSFTGADQRTIGVFEAADGGTLLLDEIGELCPSAQAALLRVLDTNRLCRVGSAREIKVDVRILAATNRDLEKMCREKQFRADLYYRLSAAKIKIPALRDRVEEIEPLAHFFLRQAAFKGSIEFAHIDEPVLRKMKQYPWPGNVRELFNVIHQSALVASGSRIVMQDLPDKMKTSKHGHALGCISKGLIESEKQEWEAGQWNLRKLMRGYESRMIEEALKACRGNKTDCARMLNLPYRTLLRKIDDLHIRMPGGRHD